MPPPIARTPPPSGAVTPRSAADALRRGVEYAVLAPSLQNTRPWLVELHGDRLLVRADRSGQLAARHPTGRELVQSAGAAVFNIRVGIAASGWTADVERLPDPGDADALAVVRPGVPAPDPALAVLATAGAVRRTTLRPFAAAEVPDDVLGDLTAEVAAEDVLLVPVVHEEHRRLVARLTEQAGHLRTAEPAHRGARRPWLNRRPEAGDGTPAALPHVDVGLLLLATRSDDQLAWLRCGEAMQRVLLELAASGWAATPFTLLIEVPLTRTQLRSALTWDAHPQLLLRVGRPHPAPPTPRRLVDDLSGPA